jgi:hypothetical protein
MEYIKLIFGIGFIATFTRLLLRNRNRSGFIHTLFRIDTLAGMVAGLYLIFTSIHSLLVH